jgi:hypothetical protein
MPHNQKIQKFAEYLPPARDTFQAPNAGKPNQVAKVV